MLQPLDLMVAIKLAVNDKHFTQAELAHSLDVSASQVNRALKRCQTSGLVDQERRRAVKPALLEFLIHGAKYVFPGEIGAIKRGMPTAHSALPLATKMAPSRADYVWPVPWGDVRGESVIPLYRSAPFAANKDVRLYEVLALFDAIRIGRVRERNHAITALKTLINSNG